MLEMEREYSAIKSVLEPLFTIKEIKWLKMYKSI
jgi:hypothetical protein